MDALTVCQHPTLVASSKDSPFLHDDDALLRAGGSGKTVTDQSRFLEPSSALCTSVSRRFALLSAAHSFRMFCFACQACCGVFVRACTHSARRCLSFVFGCLVSPKYTFSSRHLQYWPRPKVRIDLQKPIKSSAHRLQAEFMGCRLLSTRSSRS